MRKSRKICMVLSTVAVATSASAQQKPAATPFVAPAQFGTVPLPTPASPVYIISPSVDGKSRRIIAFRAPCKSRDDYNYDGIRSVAWKNSAGEYVHFTWCPDGSAYTIETFASDAALARMQALMASSGSLNDVDGRPFSWDNFTVRRKFEVEYWSWPQLEQNWFARPARPASQTAATAPTANEIARLYASYHAQYNATSSTTAVAGESAISMPLFGVMMHIRRTASNVKCTPSKGGSQKCSYATTFETIPNGAMAEIALAMVDRVSTSTTTDTFSWSGNGWQSETLRAWTEKVAAQRANSSGSYSSHDEGGERRSKCLSNALQDQVMAICF